MNKAQRTGICIALAAFVIMTSYYFNSRSKPQTILGSKLGKVTKIIDAQTIEINSTRTMSLNGIIAPFSHEKFYENAYEYLNKTLLNRDVDVLISKTGWDSKNPLVYIFLEGENINAAMVEQGLAQTFYPAYQPGTDIYYYDMQDAQIKCLKNQLNLCNLSKFSRCLIINQLLIENEKKVVIKNQCKEEINLKNWAFKGNGRIQKEIRENMILGIGEEAIIEMNNYIFDTVNEQFKKYVRIIDNDKQLVFYHDFY